MVGSVFLELHASEEVDIGGVSIQIVEIERDLRLSNRLILFGIVDQALLDEITASAAPASPEAEFEKRDRQRWGWDRPDHAYESLLSADFGANILAEDRGLKVW